MKKELKSKEYLYFDQDAINSFVAQTNKGSTKKINEHSKGTNKSKGNNNNKNYGGGINKYIDLGMEHSKGHNHNSTRNNTSKNQEIISLLQNDYSLDYLLSKLRNVTYGKEEISDASDGSFLNFRDKFILSDIKQLDNMINSNGLDVIFNDMKDSNNIKDPNKYYEYINELKKMVSIVQSMFYNSTLIKIQNGVIIANNNNFRVNHSQLQMYNATNRKINIFGIAESTISKNDLNLEDYSDIIRKYLFKYGFGLISSKTLTMALKELFGLKENDKLIRPLALYF